MIQLGNDRLYTTKETAELLNTTEVAVRQMRVRGSGCPYIKIGPAVFYKEDDITAYIVNRTMNRHPSGRKHKNKEGQ